MRFRIIGRNEQTQTEVVRDIVCDTQEDAEAFAVFEGILIERIEPLPESPNASDHATQGNSGFNWREGLPPDSPDAPDHATSLISSTAAAPAQLAGRPAEFGAAPSDGLPAPLDDPLRVLRQFLGWLMLVELAFATGGLVYSLATSSGKKLGPLELAVLQIILALPWTFALWRLLPNRLVNAFYVRSFRHDADTAVMRKILAAALGRQFRLSGIRDPRRRWIKVLRYLTVFIFALRYATPKFMNLEAGTDWKRRLWRSLGGARLAVIDVSHLTPFVAQEIQLCVRCLGLDRILFIGNSTKDAEAWKAEIDQVLNRSSDGGQVHVAIWYDRSASGRRAFEAEVRRFAGQVPAEPAGLRHDAFPLPPSSAAIEDTPSAWGGWVWIELVLGLVLAWVLATVFNVGRLLTGPGLSAIWWFIPLVGLLLCELWQFLVYLKDCGTLRERCLTLATFGFAGLWLGVALANPAIEKVRMAAQRMNSANNLRQIGIAMDNCDSNTGRLPPGAIYSEDGTPLLSWRVAILRYIGEESFYRQFHLDEPWDSPHNKPLLANMPKCYAAPGSEGKTDQTFYRIFHLTETSGLKPTDDKPPFVGRQGSSLNAISAQRGAGEIILVVEAADSVPWTKPDELPFPVDGAVEPLLGGLRKDGGYQVVFANGFVRFFSKGELSDTQLKAAITYTNQTPLPR